MNDIIDPVPAGVLEGELTADRLLRRTGRGGNELYVVTAAGCPQNFEPTSTNVAAAPMPIAFDAAVVTARVGHVPKTRRNVGFSDIMPLKNTLCSLEDIPSNAMFVTSRPFVQYLPLSEWGEAPFG